MKIGYAGLEETRNVEIILYLWIENWKGEFSAQVDVMQGDVHTWSNFSILTKAAARKTRFFSIWIKGWGYHVAIRDLWRQTFETRWVSILTSSAKSSVCDIWRLMFCTGRKKKMGLDERKHVNFVGFFGFNQHCYKTDAVFTKNCASKVCTFRLNSP